MSDQTSGTSVSANNPVRPPSNRMARAASAPQMGVGAAFALTVYGVIHALTSVELDGTTVGAWTALCEGVWQMIRRTMEPD